MYRRSPAAAELTWPAGSLAYAAFNSSNWDVTNHSSTPRQFPAPASAATSPTDSLSNRQLLVWMFGFLRPVKGLVLIACLVLALTIGTEVLSAWQTGETVTFIQKHFHKGSVASGFWSWLFGDSFEATGIRAHVGLLIAVVLAFGMFRYFRETTTMLMSMSMVYYIREAVYDKLQHVGFRFHDKISTGQLINRALTDLNHVRTFIQTAVLTTLDIILVVGFYILLLLTKSWWVAALSLAPVPIWTWYIVRFGRKVQPVSKAVMEAQDRNVSIITENIAGVHVVKAFATQELEVRKYNRNADLFMMRVLKRVRLFANFTPIIRAIATASHLSLFLAAGILIIHGELEVGDFLVLGQAMGSILSRLQQVSVINDQYQNAIVSARRLHEVLHAPPAVPEKPDAIELPRHAGTGIRFENVTFGYDPDKPVLKNITFEVKPGMTVAIVGPTGAGKSTLVSLLSRFYDPQEGRITIDGIDLRDLKLASVRSAISYVFQETYLFSDTVENNISYGRPHIKGGEVEAAARLAQAHDFIMELSKGYQTILSERGSSLSGGQRQRLAIARAILFNPRILVLDDATAAVDPETDDLIRRGMRFVMQGLTTFVIAHRISTVKAADLVIVLEEGRITQMGTHDQLMAQEGHYRDIAVVQLYGALPGEDAPSHMDRMHRPANVKVAPAAEVEPMQTGESL